MNITMKNGHFDLDLDQCESVISKLDPVIGGSPLAYAILCHVFGTLYMCMCMCVYNIYHVCVTNRHAYVCLSV